MSPEKVRGTDRKPPNSFTPLNDLPANKRLAMRIAPFTTLLAAGIAWILGANLSLAASGDWYLHLNGASRHLHRRDLNEQNWGAGFTYAFRPSNSGQRFLWAAEGDVFKDSLSDPSGYIGASVRRRFRHFDVGLLGFVMYRESADETIGSKIFPGALPFVEFGSERVRLRTAYIPRVTSRDDEAVTFQLLIKL